MPGIGPTKEYKTTLLGPDDIQVRITEDRAIATAIAADGLIMDDGGTFDGDGTIARAQAANVAVIHLTDPWGTSIEVSQGLVAAK